MAKKCCVVICYWTGRSPRPLHQLLFQLQKFPAGKEFDVVVVCNGGDYKPLSLPSTMNGVNVYVINRPNSGWNLGAWDAAWRQYNNYEYFLFLQSECEIIKNDWLRRFVLRMEIDTSIGLVGERLMWQNMSWVYAREATRLDAELRGEVASEPLLDSIGHYKSLIADSGTDPGHFCTHLVSVILFTSKNVMEKSNGLLVLGDTYQQAVASEIGTSRRIWAAGFKLTQICDDPFSFISHPQWVKATVPSRLKRKFFTKLDSVIGW